MIRVYTDKNYISKQSKGPLFPLFDEFLHDATTSLNGLYTFVDDSSNCDVFILPLSINYLYENGQKELFLKFKKEASQRNKPLWIFSSGDIVLTIKDPNIWVFKLADFESTRLRNSIVIPPFIDDPIVTLFNSKFDTIALTDKPIVGYVGHAKSGFVKSLRTIYIFLKINFDILIGKLYCDFFSLYFASHIRIKYLKKMQKSKKIVTDFIFRDRYRAGVKTDTDRTKTTQEFFENIKNTQYTFCIRGGGNFSVRLYETLAMGRIPLQINTDCVLPLQSEIGWDQHCVIIEEKDINLIDDKLMSFHSKFTNEEFVELQKSNRLFWENNFTRVGYFSKIHDLFLSNTL